MSHLTELLHSNNLALQLQTPSVSMVKKHRLAGAKPHTPRTITRRGLTGCPCHSNGTRLPGGGPAGLHQALTHLLIRLTPVFRTLERGVEIPPEQWQNPPPESFRAPTGLLPPGRAVPNLGWEVCGRWPG
jgi:hypothetical protein